MEFLNCVLLSSCVLRQITSESFDHLRHIYLPLSRYNYGHLHPPIGGKIYYMKLCNTVYFFIISLVLKYRFCICMCTSVNLQCCRKCNEYGDFIKCRVGNTCLLLKSVFYLYNISFPLVNILNTPRIFCTQVLWTSLPLV